MVINLYDVLSVIGKETVVEAKLDEQHVTFQGEEIEVACKEPFHVTVKHTEKDIVCVELHTVVTVKRTCSRCLCDVICEYPVDIHRTINVIKKEAYTDDANECDEISYIEDCTLDVDMLVLDELYTILPMNVLCKADCKGICKVCGTDLNKRVCDCDQSVPDPRMAVFGDIFNQFKEV